MLVAHESFPGTCKDVVVLGAPAHRGDAVKRLGSLRFDGVLASGEREAVARLLSSTGVEVASWTEAQTLPLTYAAAELPEDVPEPAVSGGRFTEPRPAAFEIVPRHPLTLAALARALGGPGRPACIVECRAGSGGIVVECTAGASLRLILDVVDAELSASPGRTVRALLPVDDAALTAFAGATLAIDGLDGARLIETFSTPLLSRGRG
jgi:hypothetical protein